MGGFSWRRSVFSSAGLFGDVATAIYIALIAVIAQGTGLFYVLFPELGALSHDILRRPHGTWARAPVMLVVTPFLTAFVGTLVTDHLAYGLGSVLLTIGGAILIIWLLRSPIAPAISAGLLPLTLGLSSWWYPPSLLIGTGLLAGIASVRRGIVPAPVEAPSPRDRADDAVEEAPGDYSWTPFFLVFLLGAILVAGLTGWRFVLFPPLVVIAFEMFAHAKVCPWAGRPLVLPVACGLTAAAGVFIVGLLGVGPLAASCSVIFGVVVLRAFDLHVPPALAVGLLPLVMRHPNYEYPVSVMFGTLLLTLTFLAWRRLAPSWRGD
jgi:hypothetical protein